MVNGWLKQKIKEWLFSDGAKPAVVKYPDEHTVIIKSDRIVFPDATEQTTKGVSSSEADGKITTHKGDAAAHHAVHLKTLADHPLSVIPTMDDAHIPAAIARDTEVDGKITTHSTGAKHRWTLNKLLKGAGAGADPTEIDVPTRLTFVELAGGENHYPTETSVWEDWDISAIVPAGTKYVEVSIENNRNITCGARINGSALTRLIAGATGATSVGNYFGASIVCTAVDSNRIIEVYGHLSYTRFSIIGYWS